MGTERTLRCGFGDGDVAIASQLKEGNTESGEMEVEEMKRAAGSQPQKKLFGWGRSGVARGDRPGSFRLPSGFARETGRQTVRRPDHAQGETKRDVIRVHDRCCY
jgi:hypothetical protein